MSTAIRSVLALVIVSLVALAQDAAFGQGRKRVPGTKVWLEAPKGFSPSTSFPGFVQGGGTGTSIMITEVDGPFAETSKGFDMPLALAMKGMKKKSREARKMGSHPGRLYRFSQTAQGASVEKWIWVFGTEEKTVLVIGTCLATRAATDMPMLKRAVLTADWRPESWTDPTEGLGFDIGTTAGMKFVTRIANNVAYTEDGKADKERTGKAMFLIGPALGAAHVTDRRGFAEKRLRQLKRFRDLNIDGLTGYEVMATGLPADGGVRLFLYEAILYDGATYWLAIGTVAAERRAEFLPKFVKMARSFKRRRTAVRSTDGLVEVTVPQGWGAVEVNEEADLEVGNLAAACYLIVFTERRADLEDGTTLAAYSEIMRKPFVDAGARESRPKKLRIGRLPALQHELKLREEGIDLLYVQTAVEGKTHFHSILAWTIDSPKHPNRAALDAVIRSFRELK